MFRYRVMFYYKVSPSELEMLPIDEITKMSTAIDIFQGREILDKIQASSYAHMKKDAQDKVHRHFHQLAFPNVWDKPKALSLKELYGALGKGTGIARG